MFTSYEMRKALVAEHQETLRHEARHHRGHWSRRGRRGTATGRRSPVAPPTELPSRAEGTPGDQMAA